MSLCTVSSRRNRAQGAGRGLANSQRSGEEARLTVGPGEGGRDRHRRGPRTQTCTGQGSPWRQPTPDKAPPLPAPSCSECARQGGHSPLGRGETEAQRGPALGHVTRRGWRGRSEGGEGPSFGEEPLPETLPSLSVLTSHWATLVVTLGAAGRREEAECGRLPPGPRKFILQLIFTRLFNLSPRVIGQAVLPPAAPVPSDDAWEGGTKPSPEAQPTGSGPRTQALSASGNYSWPCAGGWSLGPAPGAPDRGTGVIIRCDEGCSVT